jgi:uncharacterized protein YciI
LGYQQKQGRTKVRPYLASQVSPELWIRDPANAIELHRTARLSPTMPPRLPRLSLVVALLLAFAALPAIHAEEAAPAQKPRFIYLLRLVERLHADEGWTKADEETVGRHFRHLKAATEQGQAIVVGRTLEAGDKTFGLVIFEAETPEEAKAFADSDPAVVGGIMTVEVRPFALVLMRKME